MTPEERVGKTANIVIFLGILYSISTIVALIDGGGGGRDASQLPALWITLALALGSIALGYGVRAGSMLCLYLTTGLFVCVVAYFGYALVTLKTLRLALRLALCVWALVALCRSIPAMHILQRTHSKPTGMSRYGAFFLRRRGS